MFSFSHGRARQGFTQGSLRVFDPSDADDFMAWARDARVSRFTREDTFKSRDDALHHIRDTVLPHPWYRAICINDDDRHTVGSIWVDPGQGAVDGCRGRSRIDWPTITGDGGSQRPR